MADKGYYSRVDIKNMLDTGSDMLVPKGNTSGAAKAGVFNKNQFEYDKTKDEYICPAGNVLPYRRNAMEDGLNDTNLCKPYCLSRLCYSRKVHSFMQRAKENATLGA